MSDLVAASEPSYLVPEDRVLAMIVDCASRIEEAASIPDARKVIRQAEVIDAVTKKMVASRRIKDAAFRLLVDAERQLGRISKQLPKNPGRNGTGPGKFPSKASVLRDAGLRVNRCLHAEKLAEVPEDVLVKAAKDLPDSRKSVNGIKLALGIKASTSSTPPMTMLSRMRAYAFLARECIAMLEDCVAKGTPPHAGTVESKRRWFENLRAE